MLKLPTAITAAAAAQSACPKSTVKNGIAKARISRVRTSACRIPNAAMPTRWIQRGTGAINVCSIVPSQRSQVMTRLMSSSTADRYAQTSVPNSRNRMRSLTSAAVAMPERSASLAMKVIASVLTTP